MVVPIERASSSASKCKKYLGNDQIIDLKENRSAVKVIGNNCDIRIERNEGCLKVIGDSCRISVDSGRGTINYIGNAAEINLGEEMDASGVSYIGKGVRINKNDRDGNGMVRRPLTPTKIAAAANCVNLRNQHSLHIGQCKNIFVPLCHTHVCVRIPDVEKLRKS